MYIITVKGSKGDKLRFEIEAADAGTALQVAAARERELRKMEKFMQSPS